MLCLDMFANYGGLREYTYRDFQNHVNEWGRPGTDNWLRMTNNRLKFKT